MKIKKYYNSITAIFLLELSLIILMMIDVLPLEIRYFLALFLALFFLTLSSTKALTLFIISIPLFTALPINGVSDSFSSWRILIIVLALRLFYKNFLSLRFSAISKIKTKLKKLPFAKLLIFFFLFLFINLVSLLNAESIGAGVKKVIFLSNIALLFPIVVATIRNEKQLFKIIKAIFFAGAIVVSIGFAQLLTTFIIPLHTFWHFWDQQVINILYGQNLSALLSCSNTWFSYYENLPATLRMFSSMPDSHSFAMLAIISTPTVLALIFYYTGKEKKYLSLALILFLLAIFFSGSRGAWVGSVFALAAAVYLFARSQNTEFKNLCRFSLKARLFSCPFFKWFAKKIENRNLIRQIALFENFNYYSTNYFSKIIICSILLFFVLMPVSGFILRQNQEVQLYRSNTQLSDEEREKLSMFERAFSISDFAETSNKGRLQIWNETLISISERPFLGVGAGNFPTILKEDIATSKMGSSAHNTYLEIASEIGIFGLIIFLLLLLEILKTARDLFFDLKSKYLKIFAGSFFVYFVWICGYGIFDVVIFNDKVLMMVVMMTGVLYSIRRIKN